MATFQDVRTISMIAGENLNGDMYKCLTVDSTGRVVVATTPTNVVVIGMLAEDPELDLPSDDSTGRVVSVARLNGSGVINGIAVGAVAAGALAVCAAGGLVDDVANIAATAADTFIIGVFKEDGVANQVVEIIPMPSLSNSTAA